MQRPTFQTILILVFLTGIFSIGCKSCGDDAEQPERLPGEDTAATIDDVLDRGKEGVVHSLPSPLQVASIIKKSGINYHSDVLHSPEQVNDYIANYEKALNLGIYGTDLGYAAMYGKNKDAMKYMEVVKQLADDIGISGAFERSTMERVEKNISNKDSLIAIVTETFSKADRYLKENERSNTAALVIAGGWVEALYIATQMIQDESSEEIRTRIGEQKISLNILLSLLTIYQEEEPKLKGFVNSLKELQGIYQDVSISIKDRGAAKTDSSAGVTHITAKSNVQISDETLSKITEKIASIRKDITS